MLSRQERVALFMSLFKGREDVFARRWEKWQGGVSGYSPVYVDQDKESYLSLTNDWVEKHLIGRATLGVYPLLQDNTSHFIVADLEVFFLAFPVSFHGKLAQYIGCIRREGGPKKVYDYRDLNIPILEKL